MRLDRLIFGGAGPKANRERRDLIDQIKWHLERWRDTDNPAELAAARRLLAAADQDNLIYPGGSKPGDVPS